MSRCPCQQLIAQSVALGAECQYRSGADLGGRERLPGRVKGHQLPVSCPHRVDMVNRQREVQAGAAPDRIRVPGVLTACGHHAAGTGGGSHPNHSAQVAQVSGILEHHHVAGACQNGVRIWLDRTPSDGNDLAPGHHTLELLEVDNLDRDLHIRREPLG